MPRIPGTSLVVRLPFKKPVNVEDELTPNQKPQVFSDPLAEERHSPLKRRASSSKCSASRMQAAVLQKANRHLHCGIPSTLSGPELRSNWGICDTVNSLFGYLPAKGVFRPKNPEEIAQSIQQAERRNETVRAMGSGMSFSGALLPQKAPIHEDATRSLWPSAVAGQLDEPNVARDSLLNHTGSFGFTIDTTVLNRSLQPLLSQVLLDDQGTASLFFVEAGITIDAMNQLLGQQSPPRALKTMGGAAAQTLAGAASTGTHGGDIDRPPLADNLRALYLIGAGGVHHWIEPSRPITDKAKICSAFPGIKPINVHYDDDLHRAALVSFGSMGVMYAAIVDTVAQYSLLEVNKWSTWEKLQQIGGDDFGPLMDGSWTGLAESSKHANELADEIAPAANRFLQVVVNPIKEEDGSHRCFVTNRAAVSLRAPSGTKPTDMGEVLQRRALVVRRIVGSDQFTLKSALKFGKAAVQGTFNGNEVEVSKKLLKFCKRNDYKWVLREITNLVMEQAFPQLSDPEKPHVDVGWKVMAPEAAPERAYKVLGSTSSESAFNLSTARNFVRNLAKIT